MLWTAQKSQKLKKWQDGILRYHTRNKRMMVYDDTRALVCDKYLQRGNELHEGDELEFENHLVNVEEYCNVLSQDISQLLQPSMPLSNGRAQYSHRQTNSRATSQRVSIASPSASVSQPSSSVTRKNERIGLVKGGHDGVPHRSLRDLLTPSTPTSPRGRKFVGGYASTGLPGRLSTPRPRHDREYSRECSNLNTPMSASALDFTVNPKPGIPDFVSSLVDQPITRTSATLYNVQAVNSLQFVEADQARQDESLLQLSCAEGQNSYTKDNTTRDLEMQSVQRSFKELHDVEVDRAKHRLEVSDGLTRHIATKSDWPAKTTIKLSNLRRRKLLSINRACTSIVGSTESNISANQEVNDIEGNYIVPETLKCNSRNIQL